MLTLRYEGVSVPSETASRRAGIGRVNARHVGIASIAAGGAFALSLPPDSLWLLSYCAFIPWMAALRGSSVATGLWSGAVVGTISGIVVARWVPAGLATFGAVGIEPWLGLLLVTVCVGGVPFALLGAVLAAGRRLGSASFVALVAIAFLGVDTARSYLSFGVPWALAGHTQIAAPGVAQLAAMGGVPLVSALVGSVNAALARCLVASRSERRSAVLVAGVMCGVTLALAVGGVAAARWGNEASRARRPTLRLLLVQPNIPVGERWAPWVQETNLKSISALTHAAISKSSEPLDLVVWPETSLTSPLDQAAVLQSKLEQRVAAWGVPLVLGAVRSAASGRADRYRNSAWWIEPGVGVRAVVDKTTAVPVAEGPPRDELTPFWSWALGRAATGSRAEAGTSEEPLRGRFGVPVLLCYEVVFPGLAAARRTDDSPFLLNLANDSWFEGSAVSAQQLAFGAFRAIEQRLALVRVAHGGISAVIDEYGETVQSIPLGTEATLFVNLQEGARSGALASLPLLAVALTGAGAGLAFARALLRRIRP